MKVRAALSAIKRTGVLVVVASASSHITHAQSLCDLPPLITAGDGADYDNFGCSVAIDDDVLLIGADRAVVGELHSGAAYIFRHQFGTGWSEEQKLVPPDPQLSRQFGGAVALDGDVALIGDESGADLGLNSGAAYVFRYDDSTWLMEQKLLASDGAEGDLFGGAVALVDDLAVIGARYDDDLGPYTGAVYVYRFTGSIWVEEVKLVAWDGAANDYFGGVLAVTTDRIMVGAPNTKGDTIDSGAVYVFHFDGDEWMPEQKFWPVDAAEGDYFGDAISVDENFMLVGAPYEDDELNGSEGAAYLFAFDGGSWVETQKIKTFLDDSSNVRFGSSVALSGGLAAIGVDYGYTAEVYRVEDGSLQYDWTLHPSISDSSYFGNPVTVSSGRVAVGSPNQDVVCVQTGAVFAFSDTDCNANGTSDTCESTVGISFDCNVNTVPDECDLAEGFSTDCNDNGVPDECEADCNLNAVADACDIAGGTSLDCQGNSIPDECEGDCNRNQIPDDCDTAGGKASDTDGDGILDSCESPKCTADVNADGTVDPLDTGFVLSRLGCDLDGGDATCSNADVNGDGAVDPLDAGFVQGRLGACPYRGQVFGNPRYNLTDDHEGLAQADLDGDGDIDLITTVPRGDAVAVHMNLGLGVMAYEVWYEVGDHPNGVTAADLDGDGDADLAVTNEAGDTLSILLNVGDGTFAPDVEFTVGDAPSSPMAGDIDHDGDLDLMLLSVDSEAVSVLINLGDAVFASEVRYEIGTLAKDLITGDWEQDEDLDLAVVTGGNYDLTLLFNRGDGTFDSTETMSLVDDPTGLAAVDLDGDLDTDLVVAENDRDQVLILLNDGVGGFEQVKTLPAGNSSGSVAVGDVNGDGFIDIVAGTEDGASVFINLGTATFSSEVRYGKSLQDIELADLDSDGDLDIAAGALHGEGLQLILNMGQGEFYQGTTHFTGLWSASVALGDINNDGRIDAAVTNLISQDVSLFLNAGGGRLVPAFTHHVGLDAWSLALSDLDLDGDPDLIVGSYGYDYILGLGIYLNQGDGIFDDGVIYDAGSGLYDLSVADLNGDQFPDVVGTSGDPVVYLNKGDGTFDDYASYSMSGYGYSIATADVDGDGDVDILAVLDSGDCVDGIAVLLNDGFGTFEAHSLYGAADSPYDLAVGDVDGDGDVDAVLVTNDYSYGVSFETLSILLNNGRGQFSDSGSYLTAEDPAAVTLSDMDGDHDLDVIVLDYYQTSYEETGTLWLHTNYGDGRLADPLEYPCGPNPVSFAGDDMDGDGDVDLSIVNLNYDADQLSQVTLMLNLAIQPALQIVGCSGRETQDELTVDCNGNLVADVCDVFGAGHFPEVIIENTTGLEDFIFVGPPDGVGDGIGYGGVIYDLGDQPMHDGIGPDFTVYEAKYNSIDSDFELIDVLVSSDGIYYVSIKDTEGPVVRLAGDQAHDDDEFARSYDLFGSGVFPARYVEVKTIGTGLWAGFTLDAVAVLHASFSYDCNLNFVPDECEPADQDTDCNSDGVPDGCQGDCNANAVADPCDVSAGTSSDCDRDQVPDECGLASGALPDCNGNARPDSCDIDDTIVQDCNQTGVPDECELESGVSLDCNGNAIPDECDLSSGTEQDCNATGIPDGCEVADASVDDCDGNLIPDVCELDAPNLDCNNNLIPDPCDIEAGTSIDCDENGRPDDCDIADLYIIEFEAVGPIGVGYPQSVTLGPLMLAPGDAFLAVQAVGDFSTIHEYIDIDLNGVSLGNVFAGTSVDCDEFTPSFEQLTLDTAVLKSALDLTEGIGTLTLTATQYVDAFLCNDSYAQLTLEYPTGADCNANAVPDVCDVFDGSETDADGNGVPDSCEASENCPGDANGDGTVDPLDAGFVQSRFGCGVGQGDTDCDAADVNADFAVDPLDQGYVLSRFGECQA